VLTRIQSLDITPSTIRRPGARESDAAEHGATRWRMSPMPDVPRYGQHRPDRKKGDPFRPEIARIRLRASGK
jgi:hypothetical protein